MCVCGCVFRSFDKSGLITEELLQQKCLVKMNYHESVLHLHESGTDSPPMIPFQINIKQGLLFDGLILACRKLVF